MSADLARTDAAASANIDSGLCSPVSNARSTPDNISLAPSASIKSRSSITVRKRQVNSISAAPVGFGVRSSIPAACHSPKTDVAFNRPAILQRSAAA